MNTAVHFNRQIPVLRRATPLASLNRRQPLLERTSRSTPVATSPRGCNSTRIAEVCGGTTAECAAVWCCCPCGLVDLLVLAVYKVPAGLCRRVLRKRRRQRLMKHGLLPRSRCGCEDAEFQVHPMERNGAGVGAFDDDNIFPGKTEEKPDEAVLALEREMWSTFYGTGFWRSPSQGETTKTSIQRSPHRESLPLTGLEQAA